MHKSSYDQMLRIYDRYFVHERNCSVLDVGSYNDNGSYRDIFPDWHYVGLDIRSGLGVDVVTVDPYHWPFEDESFDAVISGQCLEHVFDMYAWISEVARMVKINGLVIVTAPWKWPIHRHPVDCWRILPDGMRFLLAEVAGLKVLECYLHESDCWGIARKV